MRLFSRRVPKGATLKARAGRMGRIIAIMTERALDAEPDLAKLVASPELQAEFDKLANLPDAQLAQLLDILEAGAPKENTEEISTGMTRT